MNVNLELYKTFYVVAKYKHMTKASEELHVSQPAISQAIKKLEEELGGALFVRSNKGMDLTEEGEMFYSYVSGALKLINDAENEFGAFKKLTKGELKIGCSASLTKLVLLQALKEFHQDYPGIKINVVNELTSNLISDLKLGKLDFVIFNESNIKEEGLELRKLKELKMGFVYNPKYFEDKIVNIEDLNNYPLILQKEASNTRKFLDNLLLAKGIRLVPKMEVVSQDLIMEFANIGLGFGFGFVDLAKEKYKNLQEIDLNKELPSTSVYLGVNKDMSLSFASKTFIKYLK